jgi:histidinol-phosphate phosphatase family protein
VIAPPTIDRDHSGGRPAVFLDRDGTLIESVPYLSDPSAVRLLPGAAEALVRLRASGFACVLVTNQSAIGRGLITVGRLGEIHDELNRQLATAGAALDAIYYCPEAPAIDDPTVVEHDDRKPGPGLLIRAARELGLDLGASYMIGDIISDVLAGINAGCRASILVRKGPGSVETEREHPSSFVVADDLAAAADLILNATPREMAH